MSADWALGNDKSASQPAGLVGQLWLASCWPGELVRLAAGMQMAAWAKLKAR